MDDNKVTSVDMNSSHDQETISGKERRMAIKKTNKPLIEKRRRARINECLQQLKEIIIKDRQLDNARGSRLEKADILEMAVEYIRQLSHEGSPVSCLQNAYERGVERCVREIAEFMSSQRDLVDSSVAHKLTTHCRKILGHQLSTADVISQVSRNKRNAPSNTETVADSSTSPKRYKPDDDSDSKICCHAGGDFVECHRDVQDDTTSLGSPSPVSVYPRPSVTVSGLVESSANQTQALSLSQALSEPVGSSTSELYNDVHSSSMVPMGSVDNRVSSVTKPENTQTGTVSHTPSPVVNNELVSVGIPSTNVSPPLSHLIKKPVFLACPGNIFILVDKPTVLSQPVLHNCLPNSALPVDHNLLTVLPTPLTYNLTTPITCNLSSPVTYNLTTPMTCNLSTPLTYNFSTSSDGSNVEFGNSQPFAAGNCQPSLDIHSTFPQDPNSIPHVSSTPQPSVPVSLNSGIFVTNEKVNKNILPQGQIQNVQDQSPLSGHENIPRRVLTQPSQTFSHFVQATSDQILQSLQCTNSQFAQNSGVEIQNYPAKVFQENTLSRADSLPNMVSISADCTSPNRNTSLLIPESKQIKHKLTHSNVSGNNPRENNPSKHNSTESNLQQQILPEDKPAENNLSKYCLSGHSVMGNHLGEYNPLSYKPLEICLPNYVIQEHKRVENNLPEDVHQPLKNNTSTRLLSVYKPLEYKLSEINHTEQQMAEDGKPGTPNEHNQVHVTSGLSERSNSNILPQSVNLYELCPPDLTNISVVYRSKKQDCCSRHETTNLSVNLPQIPSPKQDIKSTDDISSKPDARNTSSFHDATLTVTQAEHSGTESTNDAINSLCMDSYGLYKCSNMAHKVASFGDFASSKSQDSFRMSQESSEVLDLSRRVAVNSGVRTQRPSSDINNNALGINSQYDSAIVISPKSPVSGNAPAISDKIYTEYLSESTIRSHLPSNISARQEEVSAASYLIPMTGLYNSCVWRPWGDNRESAELH